MQLPIHTVQDIGLAVRAVRKQSHIRIDDFALTAGVSKQFMTDLENGKATVQMGKVLELLKELGLVVTVEVPQQAWPLLQKLKHHHPGNGG